MPIARRYYSHEYDDTVDSLIIHTPRWMAKAMGYEGLWGMGEYGILEVWVMRESTVLDFSGSLRFD